MKIFTFLFATVFLCNIAHAAPLKEGRAVEADYAHYGYYVDHPERPIPNENICNVYAEESTKDLKALGYHPYYLYAVIPDGRAHIMTAVDIDNFTAVWDNLHNEVPITLDSLRKEGYRFYAEEIDGIWYYIDRTPSTLDFPKWKL